ncbi:hypothetical protein NDI39_00550 [Microcoleus sp. ZQ-A2]|nr:hypothetical protein [Microcoleus sp. FACHB-1]
MSSLNPPTQLRQRHSRQAGSDKSGLDPSEGFSVLPQRLCSESCLMFGIKQCQARSLQCSQEFAHKQGTAQTNG